MIEDVDIQRQADLVEGTISIEVQKWIWSLWQEHIICLLYLIRDRDRQFLSNLTAYPVWSLTLPSEII